ncbi:MAG TPA: TlpA disulfide reductase family protein, partial [Thermoflexales bacterium]|nr:TlpA disulfide reductase family protein [Thermoflexales bacterium]
MDHGMMTDTHMMTGTGMMPDMPKLSALQNLVLTDAQTGKMFKLADYLGKTVYVEPMATWCPNCRAQLAQVTSAKKQVASDNVKFVALSVEVGLDPAKLAQYAKDTGYDLQFAVLNADGLKALNDAFGQSALNPPSTPHFIIKPDGTMSALVTGPEAAAALVMKLK